VKAAEDRIRREKMVTTKWEPGSVRKTDETY
jgi:hypothetical protein